MDKTKIDWCDATWNPITGCLHECDYCYARRIAERFKGYNKSSKSHYKRLNPQSAKHHAIFETSEDMPPVTISFDQKDHAEKISIAPYPFGFQPTLHRHLLNKPEKWKASKKIFVCSMADLFGAWVPDQWIEEVMAVCKSNPQHQYFFLTKNPRRYLQLSLQNKIPYKPEAPNLWFGTTITRQNSLYFFSERHNTFLSIEPLREEFYPIEKPDTDWVIVGAETGNNKGKFIPSKGCVERIYAACDGIPVFMKDSLLNIVGEDLKQEYPSF